MSTNLYLVLLFLPYHSVSIESFSIAQGQMTAEINIFKRFHSQPSSAQPIIDWLPISQWLTIDMEKDNFWNRYYKRKTYVYQQIYFIKMSTASYLLTY